MRFGYVVGIARTTHIISSVWVFILALVILVDVFGRILFLSPLPGTKEVLQNSVIVVAFLQLPLAIFSGAMLRTTFLIENTPRLVQRLLRTLCYVLGAALFGAMSFATVPEAFEALRLAEYEGVGALRIYTWPIRFLIAVSAAYAALAYAWMIVADWRGALDDRDALADT